MEMVSILANGMSIVNMAASVLPCIVSVIAKEASTSSNPSTHSTSRGAYEHVLLAGLVGHGINKALHPVERFVSLNVLRQRPSISEILTSSCPGLRVPARPAGIVYSSYFSNSVRTLPGAAHIFDQHALACCLGCRLW